MKTRHRRAAAFCLPVSQGLALISLLVAGSSARAATYTWIGGGSSNAWSIAANWQGGAAPVNDGTADLIFGSTSAVYPSINPAYSIRSLTFAAGGSAFFFDTGPLTLGMGGLTQNAATGQSFGNNVVLGAVQTWTLASGAGALAFGGGVNTNSQALRISAGTTIGTGNVLNGVFSGTGSLSSIGAGTLVLGGANTFTGGTTLAAGRLGAGNNAALGTGTLAVAGNTALFAAGADRTLANAVILGIGNTLTVGLDATGGHALTLNGAISGLGGLTVNAAGQTVTLGGGSAANTFTGLTSVTAGTLVLNKNVNVNALGGDLSIGNAGAAPAAGTAPAATVRLANNSPTPSATNITIYGDGLLDLNSHTASIANLTMTGGELNSGGTANGGPVLSGGVTINASAAGSRLTATDGNAFVSLVSGTGSHLFTVADGAARYDLDAQVGLEGGTLVKAGAGTLRLGSGNTGGLSVTLNAGTLAVANDAALGSTGRTFTLAGGTVVADGADRTVANPLSVTGSATVGASVDGTARAFTFTGTTSLAAGATLTLSNNAATTFNGAISGAGGLTVNAAGQTVTLGGGSVANTFTGLTSVTAGTLVLSKNSSTTALGGDLSVGNAGAAPAAGTAPAATVRLGNYTQTPTTTNVTIYGDGLLDLNSRSASIANLTMTGGELNSGGTESGGPGLFGSVTINASAAGSRLTATDNLASVSLVGSGASNLFTVADGAARYDLDAQVGLQLGTLVKAGAGTLRLGSGNTGGLSVTLNAGTLAVANNLALGSDGGTFTLAGGTVVADGADRTVANPLSVTGSATVGASVDGTARAFTFSGATSLAAGATLTVSNNAATTFNGAISGAGGLLKTGNGTLTLGNTANTFTGGLTLNGGTLAIAGDGNLGGAANVVTLNAGSLLFTASTTTTQTFNLNNAVTLSTAAGTTLTVGSGASVNGGFLGAGGTVAFADGSALNGTTTALNGTATASGTVTFNNDTLRGRLTQTGGTINAADTVVSSAGTLSVGGTINASGMEIDGVTTINNGGKLNGTAGSLVFGGGARTTVNAGGSLVAASGTTVELNGALLVNNGTQTGTLNVNFGGVAKGTGSFDTVNVGDGGRFGTNAVAAGAAINGLSVIHLSGPHGLANTAFVGPQPLAAPGTVNVTSLTLGSGSVFAFSVQNAQGGAGSGYDSAHAAGTLTLAAGTAMGSQITISVASLNGNGMAGQAANFDPSQNYSFVLVQADGGISGYNPAEFTVDTSNFQNNTQGGSFSVVQQGNNLDLVFTTAVPEPSTWALLVVGAMGLGLMLRRRTV